MSWTLEELEEQWKEKQIRILTEVLDEISHENDGTDGSVEWLANLIWEKGVRGIYRVEPAK